LESVLFEEFLLGFGLEKLSFLEGIGGDIESEVFVGGVGGDSALAGAGDEADLEEVGFDDVFESVSFIAKAGGDGFDAGGAAFVGGDEAAEEGAVEGVESEFIDFLDAERGLRGFDGDFSRAMDLGVVADAAEQAVGDARGASAAAADEFQSGVIEGEIQESGGAGEALLDIGEGPEFQVMLDSESGAERGADESCAGGGAEEGEGLEGNVDGFGVHAAIDGKIDLEVFHGGVDEFLDDGGQAVDFVDEEDVAFLEVGEDSHEVAGPDESRAAAGLDADAHFVRDAVGEGGVAQSGRAVEEGVLHGFASLFGGGVGDAEFFVELVLPDAVVEGFGAQGEVEFLLFQVDCIGVYDSFTCHDVPLFHLRLKSDRFFLLMFRRGHEGSDGVEQSNNLFVVGF